MSNFVRGARVAGVAGDDEVVVDVAGLTDAAILWESTKATERSADFVGKGCFQGTPFKVRALHRTSKRGVQMLKLFFEPLKTP